MWIGVGGFNAVLDMQNYVESHIRCLLYVNIGLIIDYKTSLD